MSITDLGDRMKLYEGMEAGRQLIPTLPIMVRLDGRSFHSFCKGLNKPFDQGLTDLMIATTKHVVAETCARIGYTQSDEISLVICVDSFESEPFFNGRIQKLTSVIAALASVFFNKNLATYLPDKAKFSPIFDCRVWNVPSLDEAANCILWRELDATKNSISMAASAYYSPAALYGKNSNERQEMLFQQDINWNNYPVCFKRGTYVKRIMELRRFTTDELGRLPPQHMAHFDSTLEVTRSRVEIVNFEPLTKYNQSQRVEMLFGNLLESEAHVEK